MMAAVVPLLIGVIYTLPLAITASPLFFFESVTVRFCFFLLSPFIYISTYLLTAGFFCIPFRPGIVAGKFPRNLSHPVYGARRGFGVCWSSVYYFTPVYFAALSIGPLKRALFRMFGYKGSMNFTIYADSWIRDLPLLTFGEGAYISNKATLGTNLCLKSGDILVGPISIARKGLVGHLAIVGLGSTLAEEAEVGIGVAFGLKCYLGKHSKIAPSSAVNHGTHIGDNCSIGAASYIGVKCVIKDNVNLHAGANIPAGAIISSQDEAERFYSSETQLLNEVRETLIISMKSDSEKGSKFEIGQVHEIRKPNN